ncbi:MAG: hypothetical protein AB8G05_22995 [Oligoflexales bacterium]
MEKYKSGGRSEQFSLIELEQQYLKGDSSKLLDNAVEMMSRFINESTSCEVNGFLDTYYRENNREVIGRYKKHYSAILDKIVPFFHIALNGYEENSTSVKRESREGFGLVENRDLGNGVTAMDRIRPGGRYKLDVIKFEPKVSIGLDVTWPDAENFSIGNFADVQDSVKELIELGKNDRKSLNKIFKATIWGMEVAKDLWEDYPAKLAFDNAHVGVVFSPKGVWSTLEQVKSTYQKTGQFARVEHPNIDPIKYIWQLLQVHGAGHLGTAAVAVDDVRKFANAILGVYTSMAYVLKDEDGRVIDVLVYPYTRQDHSLLSLDELKNMYKGNFTTTEGSKIITGEEYIGFLNEHKDLHLDEVLQAKRLRNLYISGVNSHVDVVFPEADLDSGRKISESERQSIKKLTKENAEFRSKIFDKINGYVVAVDTAKDMNVEKKANIDKVVVLELKKDILRIAVETLFFESSQYKIIQDIDPKEISDFTEDEVNKVFKEFSDLRDNRFRSDSQLGKYRKTTLYKFRERFGRLDFLEDFAEKISTQSEIELDIDKFRKDLLGNNLRLGKAADYIVDKHMFPLMNGYRGIQDLSDDAKYKFEEKIKIQMKYDFLKLAVTEFGYRNESLERVSRERKYKVFDIFRKENKHDLISEEIESIYNEFINDDRLERFKIPEGKFSQGYIEANRAEMEFKNVDLYRFQERIKNIDFGEFYNVIKDLVEAKNSSDEKTKEVIEKITPETCEASCQLLKHAGYDVDVDEIKAINRRNVYTSVEVQEGKVDRRKIFSPSSSLDSVEVSIGSDSLEAFKNAKNLYKNTVAPQKIPTIDRPPVPQRLIFGGRRGSGLSLADMNSCEAFDYGRAILDLNSIFLQLRENSIFIDFLDF